MKEIEFNLIDEPWIRVMDNDCNVKEVSLKDVITNAHKYKSLRGELPTQDIAVMRVILAVIHTIYSRVDENGVKDDCDDDEKDPKWARKRWKALWEKGQFSKKAVSDYFKQWHERFWLLHPERPFFQVAGLNDGTEYSSSKLNGEISESGYKLRLFSSYSGNEKNELSYSQAARWLLHLNAYDDTSSKPTKEGKAKADGSLPSTGIGWLGKLGLIYIKGDNLFETLMLNLVMINEGKVQSKQSPQWEHSSISSDERTETIMPDNLAELYTFQSRRILLHTKGEKVVSYKLLGGDFFEKENAFFEPMTVWRTPRNKKGEISNDPYIPKRHDSTRQLWREFANLYNDTVNHCAGVIKWYNSYLSGVCKFVKTAIASVEYGDKDLFVKNVFSDSLEMHSSLLSDIGRDWRSSVENEVTKCEKLSEKIGSFAGELYLASGGSEGTDKATKKKRERVENSAKEQLYYRLDIPFRKWLKSIDAENGDMEKTIAEWHEQARRIALKYADEMIANVPETAIWGHKIGDKLYSASRARIVFISNLNKIYKKEGEK